MRSKLVFDAVRHVSNRYLLMCAAAKAIRKLHRRNTRIADTANEVFARISRTNVLVAQTGNSGDLVIPSRRAA
jgi:hypothetical protein